MFCVVHPLLSTLGRALLCCCGGPSVACRLQGVGLQGTSLSEVFGEKGLIPAEEDCVYNSSGVDFNL